MRPQFSGFPALLSAETIRCTITFLLLKDHSLGPKRWCKMSLCACTCMCTFPRIWIMLYEIHFWICLVWIMGILLGTPISLQHKACVLFMTILNLSKWWKVLQLLFSTYRFWIIRLEVINLILWNFYGNQIAIITITTMHGLYPVAQIPLTIYRLVLQTITSTIMIWETPAIHFISLVGIRKLFHMWNSCQTMSSLLLLQTAHWGCGMWRKICQ